MNFCSTRNDHLFVCRRLFSLWISFTFRKRDKTRKSQMKKISIKQTIQMVVFFPVLALYSVTIHHQMTTTGYAGDIKEFTDDVPRWTTKNASRVCSLNYPPVQNLLCRMNKWTLDGSSIRYLIMATFHRTETGSFFSFFSDIFYFSRLPYNLYRPWLLVVLVLVCWYIEDYCWDEVKEWEQEKINNKQFSVSYWKKNTSTEFFSCGMRNLAELCWSSLSCSQSGS